MKIKTSSFKMPFSTKHFNKNQRVWIKSTTGAMAAEVVGKFRGKGRYVTAWVNWDSNQKDNPEFEKFDVDDGFATRMGLNEG